MTVFEVDMSNVILILRNSENNINLPMSSFDDFATPHIFFVIKFCFRTMALRMQPSYMRM